jgi:alpha-tubulin suppressor-like RCC1 family protein
VLTEENELYAWGKGGYGRLGINQTDSMAVPQRVLFGNPELELARVNKSQLNPAQEKLADISANHFEQKS